MRQLLRYHKLLSETIERYRTTLAFDTIIEPSHPITIYIYLRSKLYGIFYSNGVIIVTPGFSVIREITSLERTHNKFIENSVVSF